MEQFILISLNIMMLQLDFNHQ